MKLLIAAALASSALSAAPESFAQPGAPGCYTRLPGAGAAPMAPGGVWTIERGVGAGAVWRFEQGPGSPGVGPGWAQVDCATGGPLGSGMHAGHRAPSHEPAFEAPRPPAMAHAEPHRERRTIIIRPRAHGQPVPPLAVPSPAPHHPPVAEHGPRAMPPMAHDQRPPVTGPHHAVPPMAHHPMPQMAGPRPHHAGPPMTHHSMPPMEGPRYAMPPMAHHAPQLPPMAHGPMHPAPMPEAYAPPSPPPAAFVFPPEPAPPPAPPRWFGDRYLTWSGKR